MPLGDVGAGTYTPTTPAQRDLAAQVQNISNPIVVNPTVNAGAGTPAPGGLRTPAQDASLASLAASFASPSSSSSTTTPNFQQLVLDSPQYKSALENVNLWGQQQQNQINFDQNWADKFYQQNLAQIGSGDALALQNEALNRAQALQSLSSQQEQSRLQKEKAQREFEQQRKYVKEALTGRGNAGGQLGLETGNLQFGYDQFLQGQGLNEQNAQFAYDTLMKQIDLQDQARQLQNQTETSNLNLNHEYTVAQAEAAKQNLSLAIAQKRGEALLAVQSQLAQLWFDPNTGNYIGPDGQSVTVAQAQASLPSSGGLAAGTASQYGTPFAIQQGANPLLAFK